MMRMWQGAVGVVRLPGLVSPAYVVAHPADGILSDYYELLFRTDGCKNEINRNSRGIVSDRNRLYWDQFKRLYLPVPPFAEQQEIVARIAVDLSGLNAAISRAEHEIALIREYRTRFVADVVTGQVDVREAAAKLPDEPEDLASVDDAETLLESEESLNESDLEAETVERHV
jgi:type I restriction enzyme S subunit